LFINAAFCVGPGFHSVHLSLALRALFDYHFTMDLPMYSKWMAGLVLTLHDKIPLLPWFDTSANTFGPPQKAGKRMAELIHFETKELPDLVVIGKEIRYSMEKLMQGDNPLPKFWGTCFEEGIFGALESQAEHVFDDSYVGFMTDWDLGDGDFSYVVGMMMKEGAQIPDGYAVKKLPACKAAVGWIRGDDTADVCSAAHEMTVGALKEKGHQCETMRWSMELYNCPRFTTPDNEGKITLDYYVPVDEPVSDDVATNDLAAHAAAMDEYRRGKTVDDEDMDWS